MALKKYSFRSTHAQQKQRLDQVLAELLPTALGQPISKSKIRMLIVAGAVYLNHKRVRIASKEILAGALLDAWIDMQKLQSDGRAQDRQFEMKSADILLEDEFIIVVNKPPGLPTQPTLDEARDNLFAAVKKFLSQRDGIAQPYLALHHRLDRDTSGVILLVKDVRANAGAAEIFSKHLGQKTYQAISSNLAGFHPPSQWVIENHLGKLKTSGKAAKFGAVRSGGDFAKTEFKRIESLGPFTWVEAQPITGRTHQIRVHLSEGKLPILGDRNYGGNLELAPRLMLHAARLTFPHPITQTQTSVESSLPKDFLQCLQRLKTI